MKKLLCIVALLGVACGGREADPSTVVRFDPENVEAVSDPETLFSSVRVVELEETEEVFVSPNCDVEYRNDTFYVADFYRKRVDAFDAEGRHVGTVAAHGRAGNEYLAIYSWQIVEGLVAIYSLPNRAIYYYRPQGGFVRKDSLAYSPVELLETRDGYWGYEGYSGHIPERVVRLDAAGRIVGRYLPREGEAIPLGRLSTVFTPYGEGVLVCEALHREIPCIRDDGQVERFLKFDFGEYNIPNDLFESADPRAAMEKQLKRKMGMLTGVYVSERHTVVTAHFQKNNAAKEVISAIGIRAAGAWRWLRSQEEGPLSLFRFSVRRMTPRSELVLIADPERVEAFSAAYPGLLPGFKASGEGPCLVLCRLK